MSRCRSVAFLAVLALACTTRAASPSFTVQPEDAIVGVGEAASFAADVSGSEPIASQWYFNATNPIPDATSCTLALAAAQTSDAGVYALVASNAEGCVTSCIARLVVCDKVWTGDGVSWSGGANWSGGTDSRLGDQCI